MALRLAGSKWAIDADLEQSPLQDKFGLAPPAALFRDGACHNENGRLGLTSSGVLVQMSKACSVQAGAYSDFVEQGEGMS